MVDLVKLAEQLHLNTSDSITFNDSEFSVVVADNGIVVHYPEQNGSPSYSYGYIEENGKLTSYVSKSLGQAHKTELSPDTKSLAVELYKSLYLSGQQKSTSTFYTAVNKEKQQMMGSMQKSQQQVGSIIQSHTGNQDEQWITINNEHGTIKYRFNGNDAYPEIKGNIHVDVDRLMPVRRYNNKTGQYIVGTSKHIREQAAVNAEELKIKRLVIQNDIYKAMKLRMQNGEQLSQQETEFMQMHPNDLQKEGLYMTSGGKLAQSNSLVNQSSRGNVNE